MDKNIQQLINEFLFSLFKCVFSYAMYSVHASAHTNGRADAKWYLERGVSSRTAGVDQRSRQTQAREREKKDEKHASDTSCRVFVFLITCNGFSWTVRAFGGRDSEGGAGHVHGRAASMTRGKITAGIFWSATWIPADCGHQKRHNHHHCLR